jgi:hypothetical protein
LLKRIKDENSRGKTWSSELIPFHVEQFEFGQIGQTGWEGSGYVVGKDLHGGYVVQRGHFIRQGPHQVVLVCIYTSRYISEAMQLDGFVSQMQHDHQKVARSMHPSLKETY